MRKIAGKLMNAINNTQKTPDDSVVGDLHQGEDFNAEVFYQRMMERDIYMHISEVSVAMIGVCLTGVSIMQVGQDMEDINTYIDDLLAIDSFVFLTSFLLAYWLIRVTMKGNRHLRKVSRIANFVFLSGMIVMVLVSVLIVRQGDYFSS